jgi:transcription initiation factor TFIIF subunit beta
MALTGTPIPTIKLEHGGAPLHASEIKIKPDPDGRFPGAPLDEDIYEDTGDLDFSTSNESIYLTRIPKYLWQAWSEAEDEQEIQIGTVRVEGGLENPKRVCFYAPFRTIPKLTTCLR